MHAQCTPESAAADTAASCRRRCPQRSAASQQRTTTCADDLTAAAAGGAPQTQRTRIHAMRRRFPPHTNLGEAPDPQPAAQHAVEHAAARGQLVARQRVVQHRQRGSRSLHRVHWRCLTRSRRASSRRRAGHGACTHEAWCTAAQLPFEPVTSPSYTESQCCWRRPSKR
jgi:hypothetical protein